MPKRKEPELDPKEQFKRFQEAAKELGVDANERNIEKNFEKLARTKKIDKEAKN
ncbi:hypothetical protein [Hyphomicrobium sp.]|jgi:hypothetical protein|uniref:hypothetical protein n=1 Tax=Hyphomicrobium sp. TaxID=82 RepID=UPI00356169F6